MMLITSSAKDVVGVCQLIKRSHEAWLLLTVAFILNSASRLIN